MRKLSPELENWLEDFNRLMKELKESGFRQTPTNAREGLAALTRNLVTEKPEIRWIQDDLVDGDEFDVPVRIYHPRPESQLPVLLYFHGGGHMAGSITVYDPICRKTAIATDHVVVSTDYRLAPECPFPAGITDALSVVKNIWKTLDRRGINYIHHLSIAGDSAGGAMCAIVAHLTQYDTNVDIRKQVLIYPSLDYTLQSESVSLNAEGYLLQKEKIEWYFDNYFRGRENRRDHSPLYMDLPVNMPESLVITAEFCPLRDDGFRYVRKLNDAGVPVEHLHFDDMIHAFLNMENLAKNRCDEVYRETASFLNKDG